MWRLSALRLCGIAARREWKAVGEVTEVTEITEITEITKGGAPAIPAAPEIAQHLPRPVVARQRAEERIDALPGGA